MECNWIIIFTKEKYMDKLIRSIKKVIKRDTSKEEKKLSKLEKADKKRDKVCDLGAKVMKAKKAAAPRKKGKK
jgi:hypothetical protein